MKKDELVSLANEMYKELLSIINQNQSPSKEQFANYLVESAQVIMEVEDKDIANVGYTESLFHNIYKDIAKKSLKSYSDTNAKMDKLTKMHERTLLEYSEQHIDLNLLTSKFDEIQNHMSNEVKKANEVISHLITQIRTLEEKSNIDSLTKVFNRRALDTYLNKIYSNKDIPYNFHLLMLDIDDFKIINDEYGHLAGDKILIFIANILKKTLRDGDKVFRYGGEEFIVILNRLDDESCNKITDRLLALIRENKLLYKGESLKVTMSVGITKYTKGDTPENLISRADKALYAAKGNGKNQMQTETK
ncbi:MAG: diguanylate cyclase [Sulfurimonas sp.]|jgi:diguanylate cyclase